MKPKKILIIDDEENNQAVSEWYLRSNNADCAIDFACNGQEALDLIANDPVKPDLILVDMVMPVMDGLGFIREFGKTPHCANTRVFIISAYSADEKTKEALNYKFVSEIIEKPVNDAAVKKILGHYFSV